ncbi:MAG TPA: Rieske 2Fe-2S domain-containing protein [Terriglobales bacterium]|nr:Rieske 2Fe-2S domain-containing protein [Terriglobales bacterium]
MTVPNPHGLQSSQSPEAASPGAHPQSPAEAVTSQPPVNLESAQHTRRAFLFKLSVALNAAVGIVLAVPLVGYFLGPAMRRSSTTGGWVPLGPLDKFPIGQTRIAEFRNPLATFDDGDTANTSAWVRRVSAQQFQVFAVNCAHLGCPVRWFPESRLFLCPCHGGAYYEDGTRASGPPERGLFEYRYRIDRNSLIIHAGDMPTLATQASCSEKNRPLVQITTPESEDDA